MKIYFNLRPSSRERMWDTVKNATKILNALTPMINQSSSISLYENYKTSLLNKIKIKISKYLINKQKVDIKMAKKADLIYMWGAFPKNIDKPFIIELDNPYCLTYYHKESFFRKREKIKTLLKKAKKITYLSEASKNHTLEILGRDFENKSFVLYPYMKENYKNVKGKNKDTIDFLFVGLDFRGKGGLELLEAFHNSKHKNIRLTFISNVPEKIRHKYSKDERIKILKPLPREKLLKYIYPKMDIMVFPSFYESFGVVLLEALSFGLGLIAVNTYAVPEMLKDGYNGILLHHPILKPENLNGKEIIKCVDYHLSEFHKKYLNNNEFYYGLYNELKESIDVAVDNYKNWKHNSLELFEEKFSPNIWIKNLKRILEVE